jgi:prepilin-type N-terminal cleavage/methylation domain-containing protein
MRKKLTKKLNKRNNRGFTLAESVLALAVISIVSVGSLSLIISAQKSTISATQKQQAQLYAADIIACYRVSDANDGNTFTDNVKFATGKEISNDNTIELDGNLTAYLTTENKTLTVTIKTGEKELTSLSFTKGATP